MSTVPSKKITKANARPVERSGAEAYMQQVSEALKCLPFDVVDQVVDALWNAYCEDRAVFLFGNGGSAALASHCACDLGKGTIMNGHRRFRVLALTDNVPLMTAWANDASYATSLPSNSGDSSARTTWCLPSAPAATRPMF